MISDIVDIMCVCVFVCVCCWILDTFRMKQTQVYICTLHAVQVDDDLGMRWTYGIYIGLYTNATMEEKTWDNSQMSFCTIGDNCIQLDMRL